MEISAGGGGGGRHGHHVIKKSIIKNSYLKSSRNYFLQRTLNILCLGSGLNDLYEQYDDLQSMLTVAHSVSLQIKLPN